MSDEPQMPGMPIIGASGRRYTGGRDGNERLQSIPAAIERGKEFRQRVESASGDATRLADLMAEAIQMAQEARGLEIVGKDGRSLVTVEEVDTAHCMNIARAAYLKARRSNHD